MPIEFKRAALRNGLDVIAEIDPAAHTAAAGFYVRTGARDEDPAQMGVSHFLEHMVFKGSSRRTAEDVDRDFDDLGVDHNAYTTGEMTAFWAHALPEHLAASVEILADIMRPALRQQDFDDEKNVVLEEIAMYDDQPFWVLYERTVERYFGGHPLGHRVLGTRQTVGALERRQMQEYADRRYAVDNTTVALAGRVDFASSLDLLERCCGGWRRSGAARTHDPIHATEGTVSMESATVNRHYSISLSPAPALQDERRYAAAILAQVLGDVEGSRLYWALIETGLTEEARAQYDGHDKAGTFVISYTCPPEGAAEVDRVIAREIEALPQTLTADDLDRVRSKIATGVTLQGELPAGRMHRLGRVWCSVHEYRTLEEELRRINAVTLEDLRALYHDYPFRPRVTGHLRPA